MSSELRVFAGDNKVKKRAVIRVGVLEDDEMVARLYQIALEQAGHQCEVFGTIADFLDALGRKEFDLLLVDWSLPDGTCDEVIKWVRERLGWGIPVMVSSARDDEGTIVQALRIGADDYVIKPLRMSEVVARIEAAMRHRDVAVRAALRMGPYEIDPDERALRLSGREIELTQKEFDLASYFFQNRGKLVTRMHLLDTVWGRTADVDTRTVDAHVSRLRKKLELSGSHGWAIVSVYGTGYRLENARAA